MMALACCSGVSPRIMTKPTRSSARNTSVPAYLPDAANTGSEPINCGVSTNAAARIERRQEIACCPQNGVERHPGLAHGEQSRPDVSVGSDATEFLPQRFPGLHKHTLQEFGILWRRLIRRHRQAAPKWRPLVGRLGAERMRVIVTHVKPNYLAPAPSPRLHTPIRLSR